MFPTVSLLLCSTLTLAGVAIAGDTSAVRPAAVLRGVLALAPVAAALVLAGCR